MKVQECVTSCDVVDDSPEERAAWGSIVTPPEVKNTLINHTVLSLRLRPRLAFAASALHGLGVLHGPPGTGKTTLARALPSQVAPLLKTKQMRRVEIDPHGLMSAEHGQSQQRVHTLLTEVVPNLAADGLPTVVILDEIEAMAVARSQASLAANPADVHRATDAVLTALDHNARHNPHLMFIATSNFTAALDEAFTSRCDINIHVPLPSREGLQQILRSTLLALAADAPRLRLLAESEALAEVAGCAVGLDGRRARKLVFEALARRIETVQDLELLTEADLMAAAKASLSSDRAGGEESGVTA